MWWTSSIHEYPYLVGLISFPFLQKWCNRNIHKNEVKFHLLFPPISLFAYLFIGICRMKETRGKKLKQQVNFKSWSGECNNMMFQGVVTQTWVTTSVILVLFFTFRSDDLIWCWKFKIFLYFKSSQYIIETCELIWKVSNQ